MKRFNAMLVGLLFASLFTVHMDGQQSRTSQPILVKKLKKAWQNNWVKVGTVTAACAVLYALGIKLNVITPALLCTGTTDCHACHAQEPKLTSNLLWKTIGIISGLVACGCGYAYYNSQDDDSAYQELLDAQEDDVADEIEFNDDFFEFADEQTEGTVNNAPFENVITEEETAAPSNIIAFENNQSNADTEIQDLINVENNITFEDIIAEEESDTPSDIIAFENDQNNTNTEIQNLIDVENSITFEDIIAEEESDTPSNIIAFENFEDSEIRLPSAQSTESFLTSSSVQ